MKTAMLISGGVDSAVAAYRLLEQGHDLHLFYIRIGMESPDGSVPDTGDCSAEEDIEMCRFIAAKYHLPFDVVSLHREYWDNVMDYALRTVKQGLTPNPDVMCNSMIKFGCFEQRWGREFDRTATGHYATIREKDSLTWLGTGVDAVKDQTDFLCRISYSQLRHLLFPIGDLPKAQVRRIAIEQAMPNAYRRDSQGICFLGKINYNDFIRRHLGERPGPIVEIETGRRLGEHRGYWFHTIGQRKGLGLSGGPWYVVGKCTDDNVVYVSQGYGTERQYGRRLHLGQMHWITADPWLGVPCRGVEIKFKNRHSPEFITARLTRLGPDPLTGDTDYAVETLERVQGIAPGQFGVIYTADAALCLGSGVITGRNI